MLTKLQSSEKDQYIDLDATETMVSIKTGIESTSTTFETIIYVYTVGGSHIAGQKSCTFIRLSISMFKTPMNLHVF